MSHYISSTGFRVVAPLFRNFFGLLWLLRPCCSDSHPDRELPRLPFRRSSPGGFCRTRQPSSLLLTTEGKVIAATLHSLLKTDYQGELDVIVVADGSRDYTAAEVEKIAATDERVRLIRQENHGKARALQRGIGAARHGLIVFIDAVYACQRQTLPQLLAPFSNPDIGRSIWSCQSM